MKNAKMYSATYADGSQANVPRQLYRKKGALLNILRHREKRGRLYGGPVTITTYNLTVESTETFAG